MSQEVTGVIMAGGKSSRMGTDKGLLLYQGKPLSQYAVDVLKPFCTEILISTQNEEYARFGLPLVPDEIPGCGPIGGIYSALKASKTSFLLILGCDMPRISSHTIEKLLSHIGNYDCVIPLVASKPEPLCAVYSKKLLNRIACNIKKGEFALYRLIKNSNTFFVDFENNLSEFTNINTPDELKIN